VASKHAQVMRGRASEAMGPDDQPEPEHEMPQEPPW
jgi:hypothetical protein